MITHLQKLGKYKTEWHIVPLYSAIIILCIHSQHFVSIFEICTIVNNIQAFNYALKQSNGTQTLIGTSCLEGSLKHTAGPHAPRQMVIQWLWGKAPGFLSLPSSQVLPMLRDQGPHFGSTSTEEPSGIIKDEFSKYQCRPRPHRDSNLIVLRWSPGSIVFTAPSAF